MNSKKIEEDVVWRKGAWKFWHGKWKVFEYWLDTVLVRREFGSVPGWIYRERMWMILGIGGGCRVSIGRSKEFEFLSEGLR